MKPAAGLVLAALAALGLGACTGDLDPPWQLDHDRIVAVRASHPGLAPGQRATIDGLLARKGAPLALAVPEAATVVSPASLSDALVRQGNDWVVTAPSADRIEAARAELKVAAGQPVPLTIGVSYDGMALVGTKIIELGAAADNPTLNDVRVNDMDPGTADLVVGKLVKVPLSVDANDTDFDVAWLTSCGTMHDFDLPTAYLKVEADDPTEGQLALLVRDAHGGVVWTWWAIRAE